MRRLYFDKYDLKSINDACLVLSERKNNILTKELKNIWFCDECMTPLDAQHAFVKV